MNDCKHSIFCASVWLDISSRHYIILRANFTNFYFQAKYFPCMVFDEKFSIQFHQTSASNWTAKFAQCVDSNLLSLCAVRPTPSATKDLNFVSTEVGRKSRVKILMTLTLGVIKIMKNMQRHLSSFVCIIKFLINIVNITSFYSLFCKLKTKDCNFCVIQCSILTATFSFLMWLAPYCSKEKKKH